MARLFECEIQLRTKVRKGFFHKARLKHVVKRHVQEGMQAYSENKDCLVLEENWFGFKDQKTLYRTQKGFEVFLRLVEERAKEYNVNLSE